MHQEDLDMIHYCTMNGDIISGECTMDILIAFVSLLIEDRIFDFISSKLKDYDGTELSPDITPDALLFVLRTKGILTKCNYDGVVEDV